MRGRARARTHTAHTSNIPSRKCARFVLNHADSHNNNIIPRVYHHNIVLPPLYTVISSTYYIALRALHRYIVRATGLCTVLAIHLYNYI